MQYLIPDKTEPDDDYRSDAGSNYESYDSFAANFNPQNDSGFIPDERNQYGQRSASPVMSYAPGSGSDWRFEDPASDGDFMSVYQFSDPRLARSWTLDSFPRFVFWCCL